MLDDPVRRGRGSSIAAHQAEFDALMENGGQVSP